MCWFPVDTGGKAAIRFSVNWRVEKGDLVVVLDLHGETDWCCWQGDLCTLLKKVFIKESVVCEINVNLSNLSSLAFIFYCYVPFSIITKKLETFPWLIFKSSAAHFLFFRLLEWLFRALLLCCPCQSKWVTVTNKIIYDAANCESTTPHLPNP